MKILITGANGQLGRDIQKLFQKSSIDLVAPGSTTLDISDLTSVIKFISDHPCDVIINCAAYNDVDLAEKEWKMAFAVNGLGPRNLAIAAHNTETPLVHFSTDYIFDGLLGRPYTIADIPRPVSRYGESKLLGESFLRDLTDRFILIRTASLFGTGNWNFPKKIIEWGTGKKELKVITDLVSSPTYTVDLARATLDIIKKEAYGTFHITNSGFCSRYEWAGYILEKIGWEGNILPCTSGEFPTIAKRPPISALDNFGTEETLGYSLPGWMDATDRFLKELELM